MRGNRTDALPSPNFPTIGMTTFTDDVVAPAPAPAAAFLLVRRRDVYTAQRTAAEKTPNNTRKRPSVSAESLSEETLPTFEAAAKPPLARNSDKPAKPQHTRALGVSGVGAGRGEGGGGGGDHRDALQLCRILVEYMPNTQPNK